MSNSSKNSALSGMLAEEVTVRKVRSQVVVKNRPQRRLGKPGGKPADNAETIQDRFQSAVQYAKLQTADQGSESFKLYATGITSKKRSAFTVAMSDYLGIPKVLSIDTLDYSGAKGDMITVRAKDDFMVTKVKIVITDAAGNEIEEGEAGPDLIRVGQWEYKAKTAIPDLAGTTIKAVAYDRPGNTGILEVKL